MRRTIFCVVLAAFLIMLTGCNLIAYPVADPFYTSKGDWDSTRFPLLKPYEAANGLDGKGWFISLPDEPVGQVDLPSIEEVDQIAVEDGTIMVHSSRGAEFHSDLSITTSSWFVLIPARQIQQVFANRDGFERYVQDYGIKEINWESPDVINQKFANTGCLDWIPGCE